MILMFGTQSSLPNSAGKRREDIDVCLKDFFVNFPENQIVRKLYQYFCIKISTEGTLLFSSLGIVSLPSVVLHIIIYYKRAILVYFIYIYIHMLF